MNEIQTFHLRKDAWYGDNHLVLSFPASWQIHLIGNQDLPALTPAQVLAALQQPVQSPTLRELARGKRNAVILVDDLSRPTPLDQILPQILSELIEAGLQAQEITLLVSGGTHHPTTEQEMARKLGNIPLESIQWSSHDCHAGLVDLGVTNVGIPVQINRKVVESDLKIGLGCVYPHPAAGFSGGPKILAPGAAGYQTVRALHDQTQTARQRGGDIHTEFRQQIKFIAEKVGLDFIVNATLNQNRDICGVHAGHYQAAFEQAVHAARRLYAVQPHPAADIVIADLYPFDIDFQVAMDRGLWPFDFCAPHASRVAPASCPQGVGGHELFPVTHSFTTRLLCRLRTFRPADLLNLPDRLRGARHTIAKKNLQACVLSAHLTADQLHSALPKTILYPHWETLLEQLIQRHGLSAKVTVALCRCAPLMIPAKEGVSK